MASRYDVQLCVMEGDNLECVKIYLSGGMTGLSYEEQIGWRNDIQALEKCEGAYKYKKGNNSYHDTIYYNRLPIFFNPVHFYNQFDEYDTEKEIFEFETNKLRNSDLVVVNFNAPQSIGTAMELMLAKELHIPIIGLNADGHELHPWLVECCMKIFDSMEKLKLYVVEYYLS